MQREWHGRSLFATRCAAHRCLDAIGRVDRILMLPDDDQAPACRSKSNRVASIPQYVALELRLPIGGIRARHDAIDRASMPEAALTFDSDALPREDHVRTESQTRHRGNVLPKPESATMKFTSECDFRLGVLGPIPLHDRPDVR
jgi:hypothetical protein